MRRTPFARGSMGEQPCKGRVNQPRALLVDKEQNCGDSRDKESERRSAVNFSNLQVATATVAGIPDWIAKNDGAVIAIATAAIALSTLFTVVLTWRLVRENRLLRKAETEPEVVGYLAIHPLHLTLLNFVLANVGRGPARNVKFELDVDEKELTSRDILLKNSVDRKPISVIPQGEVITAYFGNGGHVTEEPKLPPFNVNIEYEDLKGRQQCRTYLLDVGQFEGLGLLGDVPEKQMADSLKKIEEHVRALKRPIEYLGDVPKLIETHIWKGTNSASDELTEEAKTILRASVAGGGITYCREYGRNQNIEAGGESLIPDQRRRTIATWFGGLEDLRRRQYIEDIGHKGEVFRVTREGYKAADKLA